MYARNKEKKNRLQHFFIHVLKLVNGITFGQVTNKKVGI